MAKKRGFGFGIVGCGMIADFHARAISAMKGAELVAVVDVRPESVQRFVDVYGCAGYSNIDDFVAHDGLDIVTIATPSGLHMEPVVAAANAGKHIICEKPLDVTLERIDTMIDVCRKNGVMLAGIFPKRFAGATQAFKKAVDQGRFGKITDVSAYVKWWRTQEYYDSGAWRGTWKLDGGGCLMNQGIHTVDLLYYLGGEVDQVVAFADRIAHDRIEVEDAAVAAIRFKSGAVGVIQGSTNAYPGHAAEVHVCGTDGSVFLRDDSLALWEFRKKRASDKKILELYGVEAGVPGAGAGAADPKAISFAGHQLNFENAVKAIKTGATPLVDGLEGRKAIEIILAIYQSALKGGKPVTLPLKRTPPRKSFR